MFSYCLLFRTDPALLYSPNCSNISNPVNQKHFLAQTGKVLRVKVFLAPITTLIAGFACATDVKSNIENYTHRKKIIFD